MEEDDKDLDALALDITTDEIEVTKEDTSGTWEHEDLAQVKIKVMRGHKDSVTGCQFCCDDTKVLTCSNDKTCILWDIESGKPVQTYEGHARFVTSCSMKHDNTKFVSSSWDKTVTMWDVETAKILWQGHHDGIVTCCKFSNNGKYVVSGSDLDYALNVWNAKDGSLIHHRTNHHKSTIASCSFSPNDERVCTTSMDKTTKIWDTISHNVTVTLRSHINVISTCCFSKDERRLCTGSWDKQLQMWDISTGMFRSEGPVTLNKGHEGSISSCQFSQDGSLLVSGSYDQTAAVWDADSCILKLSLKGHMDWVCGVDISADMKWILSGSRDKTVRLWNIEDSDNIPLVMENKRSMGLKIVKCGTCGKPFSISQLEDPSEFKVCVFCRLHKGRPLSHMTSIATDEDVPEM